MSETIDVKSVADKLLLLMRVLEEMEPQLDELLETVSKAHAVGPILDPTAYRDFLQRPGGNMDDVAAIARELRPAIARFRELRERMATA